MYADPVALKIRPEHRERQAFIYVRQSTLLQVREHTASRARQYDLAQRAVALGWAPEQVRVLDQDQGRSGASATEREGFQFLVAEVGLGHAGAVLCLEASRLARACADWYRLLEICALAHTLVIDEEGVYDPTDYNDRLLLGFKGTMSEAELHWLRQRLLGGKEEKARQGKLRLRLPVGYRWGPGDTVVLDPDEGVRAAVELVFALFAQLGSAFAVVRYFHDHQLCFPSRPVGLAGAAEPVWSVLRERRMVEVLRNPVYAGAYAYGRTRQEVRYAAAAAGGMGRRRQQAREPADWAVLLRDHHPGYLSWEQFLKNQERLAENALRLRPGAETVEGRCRRGAGRGAVREGAALLQGLIRCGRCGARMTVHYQQDGKTPHYTCSHARAQYTVGTCQNLRGDALDAAVGGLLLEAVQPAALAVSLQALAALEERAQQVERQWELRRERAHYQAELARRRFCGVDPENRLVARSLEREWNTALAAIEQVEREYAARAQPERPPAGAAEREQILALAQDLPALWAAPTTTAAERKQLLRCLIHEVTIRKEGRVVRAWVRWQTEAVTELSVPRPLRVWEARRPAPGLLPRLRELAMSLPDRAIAPVLNEEGWRTGTGLPFTAKRVTYTRARAGIPSACPEDPRQVPGGQRGDGCYTVQASAGLLNVCGSTVVRWCLEGRLEGKQEGPGSPWWIRLTPERIAALRTGGGKQRRRRRHGVGQEK